MPMMNISLPDQLKEFVDNQARSGQYGSVSEYMRDLIRSDGNLKAQEELEALLLEGVRSGKPKPMSRRGWDAIRARAGEVAKTQRRTKMHRTV